MDREVKKKYEQLIDSQERELKACRFKVWEYENKCDSYKTEIERLKGKEKILNNLGKFRNEQLDSYLKLNVHFHDAYQDVGPSQIDSAQKQ